MPKMRSHVASGSRRFALFRTSRDTAIRGLAKRGAESALADRRHRIAASFRAKFFCVAGSSFASISGTGFSLRFSRCGASNAELVRRREIKNFRC